MLQLRISYVFRYVRFAACDVNVEHRQITFLLILYRIYSYVPRRAQMNYYTGI